MSLKHIQAILKTSSRHLQNILKSSSIYLQESLEDEKLYASEDKKLSWKPYLEDVFKIFWRPKKCLLGMNNNCCGTRYGILSIVKVLVVTLKLHSEKSLFSMNYYEFEDIFFKSTFLLATRCKLNFYKHCAKNVQIRSFFWFLFSRIWTFFTQWKRSDIQDFWWKSAFNLCPEYRLFYNTLPL